ncbi:MGMT family protein [Actinomadura madurae]|uniref:MGMT family protein n=1 Tax=Actinomadura madurae TaxID=1993 RepID=UPI000D9CA3A0|nr:MGMT family protein [Actinomadura madurae]SPT51854.1 Predicted methylated DNA-protein cysteine methyltransferase [Actinomadura madurae]
MSFAEHIAPIFRAAMEILRDEGRPLKPAEVREAVAARVTIDPEHEEPNAHGQIRWHSQLGFRTGEAASIGWMTKRNGWAITEAGIQALEDFPGDELYRALGRQYRARRQANETRTYVDPRWKRVREALAQVGPGSWTTYGDLAELVGMAAQSVGGFMAESGAQGAHRVLQANGKISPGFRWPDPERTDDPRDVLQQEGLKFDDAGRADRTKRITVDEFQQMFPDAKVPAPLSETQEDSNGLLAPFDQFQRNISYARQLIQGGQNLEHLKVGAFDVTDLYRAAWSQAVAAIDHWVTREIVDRGVVLALRPGVPRPAKFDKLTMPVALFEKIHHHSEPLAEVFRAHLEREFEYKTFQSPEKIQEGFAHVSEVKLWVKVAEILTDQDPRSPVTSDEVRARMREIARRRNNIAHTADHNPDQRDQKLPITAAEAEETIAWLESIALAMQQALGDPAPPTIDYNSAPAEAGTLGPAPEPPGERRDDTPHAKPWWDEESLLQAINRYCPGKVAHTLLAVYRHAERHAAFRGYHHGEGEYPSVTARFSVGTDEAAAWSIYIGVTKSLLSINFAELRGHGVSPQTLSQLAGNLSRLPGWTDVPQQLKRANYTARVSIESAALAAPNTANVIIEAFNALLASVSDRP